MTRRQFALGFLIVAALVALAFIARSCVLEQQRVEMEARARMLEKVQAEKTVRTKERWDAAQRLPFLKKKEERKP